MKYTVIYLDAQNKTHFKDKEIEFSSNNFAPPAPPVDLSKYTAVSQLVFFRLPPNWFGDWHPAPKRQFFCCLKGKVEITVENGEKRVFNAGDIFLLEDVAGKGHQTRVVGDGEYVAAIVQTAASGV
ncbi:MAG: cupin domain-containing protein [Candidatus Bathyarchaeia archaeon]